MTTVIDLGTDGPRTHAFVIGVGRYPHCGDVAGGAGPEADLAARFTDVTSPPRSAIRFAEWLMAAQVHDEIAPLGSVELLVSDNVPPQVVTPSGPVTVDAPTQQAVEHAFWRWHARCDAHEDNVAIFLFSGHGCQPDHRLALLEDVGESRLAFFANAIDIDLLSAGMTTRCRARTQCFFVDACRSVPDALLRLRDVVAKPLITPHSHSSYHDAPIIFATTKGGTAFGVPGSTTIFTETLIQALRGSAAHQYDNAGAWEVTTDRIVPTIDRLMRWAGVQYQRSTNAGDCGSTPIRRLRTAPAVPFRFDCSPHEALAKAELSLAAHDSEFRLRRPPDPTVWEDTADAATYEWRARFAGREFVEAARNLLLAPPYVSLKLPVAPVGGVTA